MGRESIREILASAVNPFESHWRRKYESLIEEHDRLLSYIQSRMLSAGENELPQFKDLMDQALDWRSCLMKLRDGTLL